LQKRRRKWNGKTLRTQQLLILIREMKSVAEPLSQIELATQVSNARYICSAKRNDLNDFLYISGYETCRRSYHLKRSNFPYLTLEMIIEGKGELILNGEKHSIHSGFCFCFGPDTSYQLISSDTDPLRKYFITFGPNLSSSNVHPNKLYPGFFNDHIDTQEIAKWNELILEEGTSQAKDAPENVMSLVNILVRKIMPPEEPESRRTDALVLKALKEIDRNFPTLSTIQQIADTLKVSAEHLCRTFKSNHKSSPYKILMRRKMEHAYAQLMLSKTPIQEIAYSLGFTDGFHFSRAFKKHYGLPPSSIRNE